MKRLLIASLSNLSTDARVARQIDLLASRYEVTAAGFSKPSTNNVRFIHTPHIGNTLGGRVLAIAMLKAGAFDRFYWHSPTIRHAFESLSVMEFDLVLANDLSTLPLALKLKPRHGVIYDAHEYSPRELEDSISWRFLFGRYNDYLCRRYLPEVAGMLTVSQGIANEYRANYGIDSSVLMSAPPLQNLQPSTGDPAAIRMIHHGGAVPSRRIELMIELMSHLDERFHLDLMLVPGSSRYYRRLQSLVARQPRARIIPAVPMRDVPRHLNQYDLGLYLLPPNSFNNLQALPNKFFEFIQARLALAIGPSPEMARLVRQYDCGVVAQDFRVESLADALKGLDSKRIDHFKSRSHHAAAELCFEQQAPVLLDMVRQRIGDA